MTSREYTLELESILSRCDHCQYDGEDDLCFARGCSVLEEEENLTHRFFAELHEAEQVVDIRKLQG